MTNPSPPQSPPTLPQDGEPTPAISSDTRTFLMAEFNLLEHMRESLVNLINQRFNFLLALVSATLVAISFLGTQLRFGAVFFLIASGLLGSVLMLGLMVYARSLEAEVMLIIYIRGLNRIRNYYATTDPSIRPFLTMPWYDDVPAFYAPGYDLSKGSDPWWTKFTNLPAMIAVINSTLFSFLAISITQFFVQLDPAVANNLDEPLPYLSLSGIIGILSFVTALYLQLRRIGNRLSQATAKFHVHFKSPPTPNPPQPFEPPHTPPTPHHDGSTPSTTQKEE